MSDSAGRVSSAEVNEWGCPSCGGLFVVTDEQKDTHWRLCAPEEDLMEQANYDAERFSWREGY